MNCSKELKLVAHLLNPVCDSNIDSIRFPNVVDERSLLDVICSNKVSLRFEERLAELQSSSQQRYRDFTLIKSYYEHLHVRTQGHIAEFKRIRDKLYSEGIRFILIKSDGCFPYESDNLDTLIKEEDFARVSRLLQESGYSEIAQVREPHKFLFRKTLDLDQLAFHIHTRVEWEGTQFVDSHDLWARARISCDGNEFLAPSSEDCVLITIAHLFFENHEIKLGDLLKIDSSIRTRFADWDYILAHARRLFWDDAISLVALLANDVFKDLYGQNLIPQQVLNRIRTGKHSCIGLLFETLRKFDAKSCLLKFPYVLSAYFFFRRVVRESSQPLSERLSHLCWIASDIIRRRLRSGEG